MSKLDADVEGVPAVGPSHGPLELVLEAEGAGDVARPFVHLVADLDRPDEDAPSALGDQEQEHVPLGRSADDVTGGKLENSPVCRLAVLGAGVPLSAEDGGLKVATAQALTDKGTGNNIWTTFEELHGHSS